MTSASGNPRNSRTKIQSGTAYSVKVSPKAFEVEQLEHHLVFASRVLTPANADHNSGGNRESMVRRLSSRRLMVAPERRQKIRTLKSTRSRLWVGSVSRTPRTAAPVSERTALSDWTARAARPNGCPPLDT